LVGLVLLSIFHISKVKTFSGLFMGSRGNSAGVALKGDFGLL